MDIYTFGDLVRVTNRGLVCHGVTGVVLAIGNRLTIAYPAPKGYRKAFRVVNLSPCSVEKLNP